MIKAYRHFINYMKLKNLVVVITGASSGIGRATALKLAKKGSNLVLAARRKKALEDLAYECVKLGGKAIAVSTDVSEEAEIKILIDKAITEYGKIDVWINNAAVTVLGRLEDIPSEDLKKVLDTNLLGYAYGAKHIVPHFKDNRQGILINVGSVASIAGEPFAIPYSMTQFGIRGLSLSLAEELSDIEGIHICNIIPDTTDTPIYNQAANYMGKRIVAPGNPLSPHIVADQIVKLILKPKAETFIERKKRFSKLFRFLGRKRFNKDYREAVLTGHFSLEDTKDTKGNLYESNERCATISGGWEIDRPSRKIPGSVLFGSVVFTWVALLFTLLMGKKKAVPKILQKV
jgi:short-subunit dehydrogenase